MRRANRREKKRRDRIGRRAVRGLLCWDQEHQGRGTLGRTNIREPTPIPKRGSKEAPREVPKDREGRGTAVKYGKRIRVASFNTRSIMKPTFQWQIT
eukprot:6450677-Alexandrium_andersonii.AAC.1